MQSTPIREWIPEFPGLHKLIIPKEDKKRAKKKKKPDLNFKKISMYCMYNIKSVTFFQTKLYYYIICLSLSDSLFQRFSEFPY